MSKTPYRKKQSRPAPRPTIEVSIDRLDAEGIGVGRQGAREVLVTGAFPGEQVVAEVEHEGQRRVVGLLRRVLKKSPDRVPGPCRLSRQCQGCPLVTMDYPAQLRFKEEEVRRELAAFPSLADVAVHPVWGAPQTTGYRTSVKLAMSREGGRLKIGLYRRGSHDVVDIGDCPLHHPLINRVVQVVREEVDRQGVWTYDPRKGRGILRYLLVRVSPLHNRALVTFVTAERNFREITHLAKWLVKKVPEVVSVQQNVNPSSGNVILGRDTLKMLGAPYLLDQVGETRLAISPASFFQVNHDQAARIYDLVRSWAALTREETALDLYCGIGGIALSLARDAGRVVGIEVVEEAVRNARDNARLNGLRNSLFRAGDASELIEELSLEIPSGAVAVVNPPRKGCEPDVLKALGALSPRTLIYVSCNPQTLARDLSLLKAEGLRTVEVQPVDMFPQTPHVESVARLVPADR